MDYLSNWLEIHNFDSCIVSDILEAGQNGALMSAPPRALSGFQNRTDLLENTSLKRAFSHLICPAFEQAFGEDTAIHSVLSQIEFATVEDSELDHPHVIDRGPDTAPLLVMNWHGTASDLTCLAHEVAHAVQISLTKTGSMPPVARECCAFLGELLVIDHLSRVSPEIAAALTDVWHDENDQYLRADLDNLKRDLAQIDAPYTYRHNYPLARYAAVRMYNGRDGRSLNRLFASGQDAMALFPSTELAGHVDDILNDLPRLPPADKLCPATNVYRTLGAATLLDMEFEKGASEASIETYYAGLVAHLRSNSLFMRLNGNRQPTGYATWTTDSKNALVKLTRQAAPFGGHLALQKSVARHLGQDHGVTAIHSRSAREVQSAW